MGRLISGTLNGRGQESMVQLNMWPGAGERLRGAALADGQVREDLPPALRDAVGAGRRPSELLRLLPPPASASGVGLSHTGPRVPDSGIAGGPPRSEIGP